MEYMARQAYQDKLVVESYDYTRFKSLKGKIINWLELGLIDKALKYARILPPMRILDVPCGTGRLCLRLLKRGYSIVGADISSEMVRYTNNRIKKEGFSDKGYATAGDAENLQFADNSFDAVISLRLLGHTPPDSRMAILRELKRISKKFLILAYYHKDCLQYLLRRQQRKRRGIGWHPATCKQIEDELRTAGLGKVRYFPVCLGISETIIVLARKVECNGK